MTIAEIRTILRYKISDNGATPAFLDSELDLELQDALYAYNRGRATSDQFATLILVEDAEIPLIVLYAWISICRVLACDNAKYYRLTVENVEMDKSTRQDNYLKMADKLQTYVDSEIGIIVSSLFRRSSIDGEMVSLDYDDVDAIGD